jgi:hypothetical protein
LPVPDWFVDVPVAPEPDAVVDVPVPAVAVEVPVVLVPVLVELPVPVDSHPVVLLVLVDVPVPVVDEVVDEAVEDVVVEAVQSGPTAAGDEVCADAGPATSRALAATATTNGPTRDAEITWLFPLEIESGLPRALVTEE